MNILYKVPKIFNKREIIKEYAIRMGYSEKSINMLYRMMHDFDKDILQDIIRKKANEAIEAIYEFSPPKAMVIPEEKRSEILRHLEAKNAGSKKVKDLRNSILDLIVEKAIAKRDSDGFEPGEFIPDSWFEKNGFPIDIRDRLK